MFLYNVNQPLSNNNSSFELFYVLAEYFLEAEAKPIVALRDTKNPSVKIDGDEIVNLMK